MKFVMCAVRDAKADMFNRPFYEVSVGAAIRGFTDEVNREAVENALYRHPEDFELFQLGTFDDGQADFEIFAKPLSLVTATSCADPGVGKPMIGQKVARGKRGNQHAS